MFGAVSAASVLRSICDANDKAPSILPKDFSTRYFDIHNAKTEHIWQGTKMAGMFLNLSWFLHEHCAVSTSQNVDYGRPTTIPAPGETLNMGSFMRWYMRRLIVLSFKVRFYTLLVTND